MRSTNRRDPSCRWDEDLRTLGVDRLVLPVGFRVGMPVLALAALVATALSAVVAPRDAEHTGALALVLVGVAALPWLLWLAAGEDDGGPTAGAATTALVPLAVLLVGGRLTDRLALPSDVAVPLVSLPALLSVLLFVGFGTARLAFGTGVGAYAVLAVPAVVGWGLGTRAVGPDPTVADIVTWHVGFALCAAAGYSVRLGHAANQEVVQAREALAQQEAAEQRRRIARDVHDVVAHSLAVTMLHVTAARMAVVRSSPGDAEEALVEAERHGRSSLNDIRRIVGLLRSDDASALDVAQPCLADVDVLLGGFRAAGLAVEATVEVDDGPRSAAAELTVYRVLQEALANAARHGEGSAVVELTSAGGEVRVTVTNPVGPHRRARSTTGSGLVGMRERVAAAGGTVEAGMVDAGLVRTGLVGAGTVEAGTGAGTGAGTVEARVHGGRWRVRALVPGGTAPFGEGTLSGEAGVDEPPVVGPVTPGGASVSGGVWASARAAVADGAWT